MADAIAYTLHGNDLQLVEVALDPGETVRAEVGTMVFMEDGIQMQTAGATRYDIRFVGGFRNVLFGGEGMFLAHLSGPGTVYLQSLPFSRLVDRIEAAAALIRTQDQG